jgi:hypothetical protein
MMARSAAAALLLVLGVGCQSNFPRPAACSEDRPAHADASFQVRQTIKGKHEAGRTMEQLEDNIGALDDTYTATESFSPIAAQYR